MPHQKNGTMARKHTMPTTSTLRICTLDEGGDIQQWGRAIRLRSLSGTRGCNSIAFRKILGELTIAKYAGGNLALCCRQSRWNRRSGLSRTKDGVSAQPRFCGFYLSCAVVTG